MFIMGCLTLSCTGISGERNFKNPGHSKMYNLDKDTQIHVTNAETELNVNKTRLDSLQGIWHGIADDSQEILSFKNDTLYRILVEGNMKKDTSLFTFFFINDCANRKHKDLQIDKRTGSCIVTVDVEYSDTSCYYIESLTPQKLILLYERGQMHQYKKD